MNIDMPNVIMREEMVDGERREMARVTLNADSKFVKVLDAWCEMIDGCRKIDLHGAGWTVQYLVPAEVVLGTIVPVDDV